MLVCRSDAKLTPTTMATFTTLPQELLDQIYRFIALELPTLRIQTIYNEEVTYPTFKVTTSAITATCRKVHKDYEGVAQKLTTALQFTTLNLNFADIMTYFEREVDERFLTILQSNKAKIHVNILFPNVKDLIEINIPLDFDVVKEFYPWALFLTSTKLEVEYHSSVETWMYLSDNLRLEELCVIRKNSRRVIRENIEEIGKQAEILDGTIQCHHNEFFLELQVVRHRRNGEVWRPGNRFSARYAPPWSLS